jgi:2-(1,2-epoxy-1,2-dihydrophenyl)acetyl-CoA isomerase
MNETLLFARNGDVATLTLNRPESLNVLNVAMIDALVAHTAALANDTATRCVVIRGAGMHFMAGGDIRMFAEHLASTPEQRQREFSAVVERVHAAVEQLRRMPQPVVASVHGAVAGFGLSLMCACDLAIAADTTYFTSAYRHIGLTPDGGSTWTLPRLVGTKKAMEIVLLGERFDAQEALRIGLVNRVVPAASLVDATFSIADALANGAALAIANGKRLINEAQSQSLSNQLAAEAASFGACAARPDFVEGIRAFLDKRPPRFGQS